MTAADWSTLWSIGSGVVSVTLGVLAIWLSLYFYTRGKDTERNVSSALAEIKAQTAALERLSAKQLDRLTKFATEGRPPDPVLAEVAQTFKQMSLLIMQPAPSSPSPSAARVQADLLSRISNRCTSLGFSTSCWRPGSSKPNPRMTVTAGPAAS